jgi:hypothetical protein
MRNFDSDVPIELKAEIIWFADVSMQKLSGPLAHRGNTDDVGSGFLRSFPPLASQTAGRPALRKFGQ